MPLGLAYSLQQLTIVEKIAASETKTRSVLLVRFVPLTRSSE
jgi:protein-L-isoaspartate(D-aspartate) O-methyltransferase